MLRAIIVDDEMLSIRRLNRLLSESGLVEVCGTFQSPSEAYEYARTNRVDAAFLDISMPHMNGMKLSDLLSGLYAEMLIIFVTGYEEYAVQAFDISAFDYLVKPVHEERLGRTLDKIRKLRLVPQATPDLSVILFNGIKIYSDGAKRIPLKLRSPKTEELFVYLVSKGAVSREEVIDALWPALASDKAMKNLNTNLYYIRKSLGISKAHSWIHVNRNEISIDTDNIYCDVHELETIIKRVATAGLDDTALIDRADSLYTGPFLQGRDYHWSGELARHYEQAYIGLLEAAARSSLSAGRVDAALNYFNKIIEKDKLREDVYVEIIRLYLSAGRRTDAIRCLRQLERNLAAELGVAPSPAITGMFQNIT